MSQFQPKSPTHRALLTLLSLAIGTLLALAMAVSDARGAEGHWELCEITAYCGGPCAQCETTGVTADGTSTRRRPYGIAASPNLPLGAMVYVPHGVGYLDRSAPNNRVWPIDDRGGLLRSEQRRSGITRLDLRFISHDAAMAFGRKMVSCWICN